MKVSQRKLKRIIKEEMRRTLKEFGDVPPTTPSAALAAGSAEAGGKPPIDAETYYARIKGGATDLWYDIIELAQGPEGTTSGASKSMNKEQAIGLALEIGDLAVQELKQ